MGDDVTSGFRALIVLRADSTFRSPIRSFVWRICRCRFDRSTTSKSTIPIVPTPAAARYRAAGRAETAGADEQRLRAEQPRLAGRADLGDQEMAAVALLLLGRQDDRRLPRQPGRLPGLEAAAHRGDVGVAELLEGLGREERADAAGAVEDDRGVAVRDGALDLLLDVALADVEGAGQVALLPLAVLADVDDGRAAGRQGARPRCGGDFADLRAGLLQEVGIGAWHGRLGAPDVRRAAGGGGRAGRLERSATDGLPARPAGDTRSSARGRPSCGRAFGLGRGAVGLGSALWSVSWLSIAHFRRAGLMSIPSRSRRSSARKAATSATGLPLISSVRRRRAGLADRAAAAGEPDPLDDAVRDPELHRDPVAAQRVAALEGRGRIVDDPEVVGPPIVLEDVVAVEIVHASRIVAAPPRVNPERFRRD